jgi:hypothetical protein
MQDTTSSAMTEVALGLSMAFFTLLIVSLISMGFSTKIEGNVTKIAENSQKDLTIDIKKDSKNKSSTDDIQFVFFFDGKFYDQSLGLRSIDSFSQAKKLIIAVNPDLSFAEVFSLKQQVKHPKLSITVSNDAWRSRLQQIKISG